MLTYSGRLVQYNEQALKSMEERRLDPPERDPYPKNACCGNCVHCFKPDEYGINGDYAWCPEVSEYVHLDDDPAPGSPNECDYWVLGE